MTRSSSGRRVPARLLTTTASIAAVAFALPSAAGAAEFCVGTTAAECPNGTVLSLQGALSVSQASAGSDVIRIKDTGTPYVGPFTYRSSVSGNRVSIVSMGDVKPTITSNTADAPVLDLQNAALGDLRISVPKLPGASGAQLDDSSMESVDVTGGGATDNVGVSLDEATVFDSTIDIKGGIGAAVTGPASLIATSTVAGNRAVSAVEAGLAVFRSRLRGVDVALSAEDAPAGSGAADISIGGSVLTTSSDAGKGVVAEDSAHVRMSRTTVASLSSQPAPGTRAVSVTASTRSVPVEIATTVLAGYRAGIGRSGTPLAPAPLTITDSEWDPSNDALGGNAAGTVTEARNVHEAPHLIDRVAGDVRPRVGDRAVDLATAPNPREIDFEGLGPIDGNGDGNAIADAGAFEYQRRAPTVDLGTVPTAVDAGAPASFAAAVADPDGEAVTIAWSFGDGGTGAGATVAHTYSRAGTFEGAVTARDEAGVTTTRRFTVTVTADAPVITPPPSSGAGDSIAPAFAKLALTPRRLRASASRKLRLRLRLSERATVRITVKKRVKGRSVRLRRAIVLRLAAGSSTRRVGPALRRARALRPGRYKLSVTATDAAGNRSAAKSLRLTVLPRR